MNDTYLAQDQAGQGLGLARKLVVLSLIAELS